MKLSLNLVILFLCMGILARSISLAHAQTPSFAQFELVPNKQSYTKNDKLILEIYSVSGDTKINAVEAHIDYPSSKLGVLEVNTQKSEFDIGIPEQQSKGSIIISRGSSDGIKGKKQVATIVFLVQEQVSGNEIELNKDSVIMSSETNSNILSGSSVQSVPTPMPLQEHRNKQKAAPSSISEWILNLNNSFWEKIISLLN